jgi:hypothetical protein
LTLNHSATMRVPSERELRDKGMEAFGKFTELGEETL